MTSPALVFALSLMSAGAAPAGEAALGPGAELASATQAADRQGEDAGLLQRYWPLLLEDDLAPPVMSGIWSFWVGGCIPFVPFGNIWLPLVVIDAPLDIASYLIDAILIEVIHLLPHVVAFVASFALIFGGILVGILTSAGSPETALPVILGVAGAGYALMGLNLLCMGANALWCMPVATANAYSRAVKKEARQAGRRVLDVLPEARAPMAMAY